MQGGGFQKPPGNGGCMVRKDLVKDQKWLEKIQIKNDVVFCTVFLDEEDCRELLQRILGMHIVKLKVVLNQKAIQITFFKRERDWISMLKMTKEICTTLRCSLRKQENWCLEVDIIIVRWMVIRLRQERRTRS